MPRQRSPSTSEIKDPSYVQSDSKASTNSTLWHGQPRPAKKAPRQRQLTESLASTGIETNVPTTKAWTEESNKDEFGYLVESEYSQSTALEPSGTSVGLMEDFEHDDGLAALAPPANLVPWRKDAPVPFDDAVEHQDASEEEVGEEQVSNLDLNNIVKECFSLGYDVVFGVPRSQGAQKRFAACMRVLGIQDPLPTLTAVRDVLTGIIPPSSPSIKERLASILGDVVHASPDTVKRTLYLRSLLQSVCLSRQLQWAKDHKRETGFHSATARKQELERRIAVHGENACTPVVYLGQTMGTAMERAIADYERGYARPAALEVVNLFKLPEWCGSAELHMVEHMFLYICNTLRLANTSPGSAAPRSLPGQRLDWMHVEPRHLQELRFANWEMPSHLSVEQDCCSGRDAFILVLTRARHSKADGRSMRAAVQMWLSTLNQLSVGEDNEAAEEEDSQGSARPSRPPPHHRTAIFIPGGEDYDTFYRKCIAAGCTFSSKPAFAHLGRKIAAASPVDAMVHPYNAIPDIVHVSGLLDWPVPVITSLSLAVPFGHKATCLEHEHVIARMFAVSVHMVLSPSVPVTTLSPALQDVLDGPAPQTTDSSSYLYYIESDPLYNASQDLEHRYKADAQVAEKPRLCIQGSGGQHFTFPLKNAWAGCHIVGHVGVRVQQGVKLNSSKEGSMYREPTTNNLANTFIVARLTCNLSKQDTRLQSFAED
ncbi:hypothetical protein IE81DRAFT_348871 [Ceraceosorus guamensis]|uniref:Uncharacterized protein n=1 Tax=Ceraceosorus guamensis TaxID=1522189 RepID=A0A316VZC6_9BASI|nr:hypothetical protein IE81DRAFT_348871 [Ceraceosorus guamensis]PWN40855.1 hypothetical protein IE81DRAFT_348871 [Ceraceosorus guamensis]